HVELYSHSLHDALPIYETTPPPCRQEAMLMSTQATAGADSPVLESWIGGRSVPGSTGQFCPDINPATGELLGRTSVAGAAEVDLAARTAYEAFKKWRLTPAPRRGEILYRIAQLIQIGRASCRERV